MGLKDYRLQFKPFEYDWAFDSWLKHEMGTWLYTTIPMQQDINDWRNNLTDNEKDIVGKILKGFSITETFVGDYWQFIATVFPKHEIVAMCNSFSARESLHGIAYNYLNEILDLNDFEAFLSDETTMAKLDVLINADRNDSDNTIAQSLALFSACAEGIQLFSSFAILMSFRLSNKLIGISDQMRYSSLDENLHSECGTRLFREFISEKPEIWTDTLRQNIYDGIDLSLTNEFNFIDEVFKNGDLENITKNQLKNFIHYRANLKLQELMLSPIYAVDDNLLQEMSWFKLMISGNITTDFFKGHETNYSEPNSDWESDDWV